MTSTPDNHKAAQAAEAGALLSIEGLRIAFPDGQGGQRDVVRDIDLYLRPGESLAIVGESGSGKTLIGKALLGLLPDSATVQAKSMQFDGRSLLDLTPQAWRELRGTDIGMVFQEPMVSLNPAIRIGEQMVEALVRRRGVPEAQAREKAIAMLERVRVRDPKGCMNRFPHEFSGGMRQRILLAAVMLLKPRLLIADEPTTALDCVVQKEVLDVMIGLTREEGTALIFVSHDLALVAAYTERVMVVRRGDLVETGPVARVLAHPSNDYTQRLLESLPRRDARGTGDTANEEGTPAGERVLEVDKVAIDYLVPTRLWGKTRVPTVFPCSFSLRAGQTLAIVGESGSGKTTMAKAIMGLLPLAGGEVKVLGKPFPGDGTRSELREARRSIQMVFQDPYSSLDPRMRVEALVHEALRLDTSLTAAERRERVAQVLEDVGLSGFGPRFVHQLSGGQRQRVAIARALASHPAIIVADEPVSALDVTVQKQVLEMLVALQARYRFACLLISHDLGVVEQLSDHVIVMFRGHVVESGTRDAIFDMPAHPYTRRLLQAVPELRGNRETGFAVQTRALGPHDASLPYYDPERSPQAMPTLASVAGSVDGAHRVAVLAA
ncbi:peptide ABC transporter ATP-binding protein [Pandoraea capi]|uniref:Peptide ABC transporter ATP-binding protein n=1 Tax=Pandoraea capi TaxID=2508286 RepID=A0ABY6W6R6_9BURK|nr:ABC transporter ATP-binding protein [Pandoraea capi]VVE25656.1 peptide ABC transporter ATP-binding protein [Pandoraea capi]